jgi:hypothetical protein
MFVAGFFVLPTVSLLAPVSLLMRSDRPTVK